MGRLIDFIINHETITRILAVIIPFMVVWTFIAVLFRWLPGLLDAIKDMVSTSPEVFWTAASMGALFSLYMGIISNFSRWLK